jgi:xylulokinase
MSLLGLDIGTSATKGVLLDRGGQVLGTARRGYRAHAPAPDRAELSALRVWAAVRQVIAELAATGRRAGSPVLAVCAGGSGDEVVAVDAGGRPVGPVITAVDHRSDAEARAITVTCGADELFRRTGLADLWATPLARYRWMARHDPAGARRIARLLSWPEWVTIRLGLPAAADPSLAARSLAWDVITETYATGWCAALTVPDGLLSPVVPTGTVLGEVPSRRAVVLGLGPGVRYVVGGFDQAMATLGAGAARPGIAHDGNGSWEALSVRTTARIIEPRLRRGGWSVGPSASDGRVLEAMASWAGGLVLRWAGALATQGRPNDRALAHALDRLPPGLPRPLVPVDLVTPGTGPLGGAGGMLGLDLATTHGDLLLAVLDGLAHRLGRAVRELGTVGVPVTGIRATGGGARSGRWLQLKADVTGLPVERVTVEEAGAFAAAVLAGTAVGVLPPVEEAVRDLVTVSARFDPDPSTAAWHEERARLHDEAAQALDALGAS